MLIEIRPEQLQVFRQQLLDRFDTEVIGQLRAHVSELREASHDELARRVEQGRTRARTLGIYAPPDVRRFLLYLGRYGPKFGETDQTAWAAEILGDRNRTGTEKLEALDARTQSMERAP